MPLAGKNPKGKGHTFGVRLSEHFAEALRGKAGELDIPPTTLAARIIEQALSGRGAESETPGTRGPDDAPGLSESVAALHTELSLLRAQLAEAQPKGGGGVPPTTEADPALTGEILDTLRSIAADLQKARKDQHNATVKLLRTAGGMSAAEVSDWTLKRLSE